MYVCPIVAAVMQQMQKLQTFQASEGKIPVTAILIFTDNIFPVTDIMPITRMYTVHGTAEVQHTVAASTIASKQNSMAFG